MDKKDLERRLEAAEKQNLGLLDEIKNLKAQLAKVRDEPEIPDFPEFKSTACEAWHINNVLKVVSSPSYYSVSDGDYNYFHTKEMAKEFANKCKLIAMMLHCKWYVDPDGDGKWTVYYNEDKQRYSILLWKRVDFPTVYFSTEEKAQKAADWLNAHWKEDGNG